MYTALEKIKYSGMIVGFSHKFRFMSTFGFFIQKMKKIPHYRIARRMI